MKKSTIAIDIDDTLFDHFKDLTTWYNKKYSTAIELADNHPKSDAELERWKADSIEQAVRRVHEFYDTRQYREAEPYSGALEVLPRIATMFKLVVVTARDMDVLEEFTQEWLKRHFNGLFSSVHFTAQYSLSGKSRTKLDVCRELGATLLIDDSLENCLQMVNDDRKALLFGTYPWNEVLELPSGVMRVRDWYEIERYLNAA